MTHPTSRSGRGAGPSVHGTTGPHAALLIDFDNVTLGIRSDLTKELRTLLNSDIIKGKVAVQRAYADWRRYPQYIVPLSEASIDLIFAPAFGTNKKNATDIRLAVDAIELVFTRPEIGTFILLSGDSDFSTMVIKLKEYGKYVIGVGIRESASDLLIQNCDEYYSYNDLAGLTREVDTPSIQRDPWELVGEAVETMVRNRDVMRSDRLKQVMQQIDPNFDEKNAGFNRFSRFVSEAATRGMLRLTKLDNGQFEVAPAAPAAPAAQGAVGSPATGVSRVGMEEEVRRGGGSGGGGGGDRGGRGRRGRGRGREDRPAAPRDRAAPSPDAEAGSRAPKASAGSSAELTLASAFHLLTRALGELTTPVGQYPLRDHMRKLHGADDPIFENGRFARLLRQANDAEVADVRKLPDESFEVSPHRTDMVLARARAVEPSAGRDETATMAPAAGSPPAPTPAAGSTPRPGLRFRRGSRGMTRPSEIPLVGVVKPAANAPAETSSEPVAKEEKPTRRRRAPRKKAASTPTAAPEVPVSTEGAATEGKAAATKKTARKRTRTRAKKAVKKTSSS